MSKSSQTVVFASRTEKGPPETGCAGRERQTERVRETQRPGVVQPFSPSSGKGCHSRLRGHRGMRRKA